MNARELADLIERGIPYECGNGETSKLIIRALRLLAAAEANDGSTPECRAEQELYANSNGEHAAWELAERFERKCTDLATRVLSAIDAARSKP